MKNLVILILLAIIAYLLYTSGILNRAVQSVPQVLQSSPNSNPAGTPHISVTVYSPYGTGNRSAVQNTAQAATQATPQSGENPNVATNNPPAVVPPDQQPSPYPAIDVGTFTPPPPTIIIPKTPPTLAIPNTPTPSATFTLTLDSLRDGQTVKTSPLLVSGMAVPGAVVSVNDAVGLTDAQGHFAFAITLDPGPNVLEVVASLPNGQEAYLIVTVLYQP